MRRTSAALLSAAFLVIAPGTVAGLLPWWITGWRMAGGPLVLKLAGGLLILAGLALLVDCFSRFVVQGHGTPAPVAPPENLVVAGPYRRVRNPMYVAIVAMILGQAALLGALRLLGYAALVWTGFHIFVVVYEEPTLRRHFPAGYAAFSAAVPRWIPRLSPWRGD